MNTLVINGEERVLAYSTNSFFNANSTFAEKKRRYANKRMLVEKLKIQAKEIWEEEYSSMNDNYDEQIRVERSNFETAYQTMNTLRKLEGKGNISNEMNQIFLEVAKDYPSEYTKEDNI